MPCNSGDDLRREQSSTTPSESPLTSLIHQVFAIPRAIYERGVERGDEWRQRRNQHDHESESSCTRYPRRGLWRREDGQLDPSQSSENPSDTPTLGNGAGEGDGDDWVSWLKREAARGEKRAKEMYESWEEVMASEQDNHKQEQEQLVEARDFIDELEKSHQRNIERLYTISANSAPDTSDIPEKAIQEFVSNVIDPAHSALWSIIPNIFAAGAESWDPEGETAATSHMISYAMWSLYSPLHLERWAGFDKTWRARFEDLIRAERGEPFLTQQEIDAARSQKSGDWLKNLMSRYDADQSPLERLAADSRQNSRGETELDAYNKIANDPEPGFLANAVKRHRQQAFERSWSYSSDAASQDSDTVTSVTRTVDSYAQPDGSLITKTVIQRRFQDGREEKTENIAKSLPPSRNNSESSNSDSKQTKSAAEETKQIKSTAEETSSREPEQSRRGWFWSK